MDYTLIQHFETEKISIMDELHLSSGYLSEHFSLEEATVTQHLRADVTNTPTTQIVETMKRTALKMEKVRYILGNVPILVNSWYRSPAINKSVGGSATSQHCFGEAVDFIAPRFGSPYEICKKLMEEQDLIRYDQLIFEYGWVHISFAITTKKAPRGQVLTINPGKKVSVGLVR